MGTGAHLEVALPGLHLRMRGKRPGEKDTKEKGQHCLKSERPEQDPESWQLCIVSGELPPAGERAGPESGRERGLCSLQVLHGELSSWNRKLQVIFSLRRAYQPGAVVPACDSSCSGG